MAFSGASVKMRTLSGSVRGAIISGAFDARTKVITALAIPSKGGDKKMEALKLD